MEMNPTELIKTGNSYLTSCLFNNLELLELCVEETIPQLEIRPEIIVYGRKCNQNRNVGFFSDTSIGYYYSNQLSRSKPLSTHLKYLLEAINTEFKCDFNGILVNQYMDGNDYIGAHSDDETGLGCNGVVGISIGATRKFRIRDKSTKKIQMDIPMTNGCIIHMAGNFQKEFTHEIPIEKKIKETRVSFTFRKHSK